MIQNADVGYHHLGGILPPGVHQARMVDLSQSAQTGAMWSQIAALGKVYCFCVIDVRRQHDGHPMSTAMPCAGPT